MSRNPKNLAGYCGLYCGACGIYQGRIKHAVGNLRNVIGAYGFDKIHPELAKWEPSFEHYPQFEKVMDGLIKLFGECPGCVDGGGDPGCIVRQCCKEKAIAICTDCTKMDPCKKLHEQSLKRLQKIRTQGFQNWFEEMQRKVNAGYCYLDEKVK